MSSINISHPLQASVEPHDTPSCYTLEVDGWESEEYSDDECPTTSPLRTDTQPTTSSSELPGADLRTPELVTGDHISGQLELEEDFDNFSDDQLTTPSPPPSPPSQPAQPAGSPAEMIPPVDDVLNSSQSIAQNGKTTSTDQLTFLTSSGEAAHTQVYGDTHSNTLSYTVCVCVCVCVCR